MAAHYISYKSMIWRASRVQTRADCSAFNAHKIRPKRDLIPGGSMVWRSRTTGIRCEPRSFATPKSEEEAVLVLDVLTPFALGSRTEAQLWIEQGRVNVSQNRWIAARESEELRVDSLPLRYRSLLVHKPADIYCNWATRMSLRELQTLRPIGLALFPFGFHQTSGLVVLTNQPEVVNAIRDSPVELLVDFTAPIDAIARFDGTLVETDDGRVVSFPNPKATEHWIRRCKTPAVCIAQGGFRLPPDLDVGVVREIT